jgi:GntR family transcriptional regulator, transcriptional repressor for pyruvate dehydrogenase complex
VKQARRGDGRVNQAIVRAIQEQIRRGELKPGDRLPPERHLTGIFGASRSSVREALRALELSGLVYSRHGEGNFVADTLPVAAARTLVEFLERQRASMLDLSEARKLFEPYLASLAATRATADDLEELRRAAEDEHKNLREGHTQAAFRADRSFHQAVAAATRNQALVTLHSYLSDLVGGGQREALENDVRRAQSAVDHRRVYRAIARRDGAAARTAMLTHLENVERILMDAVGGYQRAAKLLAPRRAGTRDGGAGSAAAPRRRRAARPISLDPSGRDY